jgi:hypothetical protein
MISDHYCCYIVNHEAMCVVCKKKLAEHSELQDKICEMITIKQFANDPQVLIFSLGLSLKKIRSIIPLDICLSPTITVIF